MNRKLKYLLVGVVLTLLGFSFYPFFEDPFHEKLERVCFWEWIGKEIWELIYGEK